MLKSLFYLLFVAVLLVSCKEETKSLQDAPKKGATTEVVDIRPALNGFWLLISQSFTKGRKLEKFPVGGSVSMILNEDNEWYTLDRKDTVCSGHFTLENNEISLIVDKSSDETSCSQIVGKIKLKGRFLQIEGFMSYNNKGDDYMHALFGRSRLK